MTHAMTRQSMGAESTTVSSEVIGRFRVGYVGHRVAVIILRAADSQLGGCER